MQTGDDADEFFIAKRHDDTCSDTGRMQRWNCICEGGVEWHGDDDIAISGQNAAYDDVGTEGGRRPSSFMAILRSAQASFF